LPTGAAGGVSSRMESATPQRDTAGAMSEENVEIVRAQIDAYNRGDYDAALGALDEEVEWQVPGVAALDAPGVGRCSRASQGS
jgi:hypothetical protein